MFPLIFAIAAIQAEPPVAIVTIPKTPEPSLENYSRPKVDLNCILTDKDGNDFKVEMKQLGGRAYQVAEGQPLGRLRYVPVTFSVEQDETGNFLNPIRISGFNNGKALTIISGISPKIDAFRFQFVEMGGTSLGVLVDVEDYTRVGYVGVCDADVEKQEPLSEEETREFLKK